ncbi:MAG: haloalkane dehalogenase [Acidimicrobiales bacterium]
MDRLRTPEERFTDLPDFPYGAHYADVADPTGGPALRAAYLDEGPRGGATVLLLHGEPSWSYLYRRVIAGLAAAGRRVVAPDMVGFGRSDKPTQRAEYTYARHVEWMRELLFDRLDLTEVTLFGQDWGSLVGLRLVGEHPQRFARVVIANGGLPTGEERPTDAFTAWQAHSQTSPTFNIGRIVAGGCATPMAPEVIAAYDAPFPDDTYKAGARQYPTLVPTSPDDPAHDANVAAWSTLRAWSKPFLVAFSDLDQITRGGERRFLREVPGCEQVTMTGGGHFLQEDVGPALATVIDGFVART